MLKHLLTYNLTLMQFTWSLEAFWACDLYQHSHRCWLYLFAHAPGKHTSAMGAISAICLSLLKIFYFLIPVVLFFFPLFLSNKPSDNIPLFLDSDSSILSWVLTFWIASLFLVSLAVCLHPSFLPVCKSPPFPSFPFHSIPLHSTSSLQSVCLINTLWFEVAGSKRSPPSPGFTGKGLSRDSLLQKWNLEDI